MRYTTQDTDTDPMNEEAVKWRAKFRTEKSRLRRANMKLEELQAVIDTGMEKEEENPSEIKALEVENSMLVSENITLRRKLRKLTKGSK